MNINVATWARIIKRSQPNEHQHSNTGSLSSGGSVARPSSLSSSTRPLPLNLITSPASVSLPPASTSSNSSPPPPLETPADTQDASHNKMDENHKHGMSMATGTSMARPLSLSLSSPVVPMAMSSNVGIITSPVTPTLTSTIVPIQFPPSGKKPAPPPPPRTTSVVTIGHTTPVGQPSGPPPQPVPRSYHHSTTPSDPIEDAKVRKRQEEDSFFVSFFPSTFSFIYPWLSIFLHLSIDKKGKLFIFHQHDTHLPLGVDGWMVCLFIY